CALRLVLASGRRRGRLVGRLRGVGGCLEVGDFAGGDVAFALVLTEVFVPAVDRLLRPVAEVVDLVLVEQEGLLGVAGAVVIDGGGEAVFAVIAAPLVQSKHWVARVYGPLLVV